MIRCSLMPARGGHDGGDGGEGSGGAGGGQGASGGFWRRGAGWGGEPAGAACEWRGVLEGWGGVRERLEAFGVEVLAGAVNRPVQLVNGGVYLRGLIEQGPRKSLEPMVGRLGGGADYESLQNFLAVSTWDPALVVRALVV